MTSGEHLSPAEHLIGILTEEAQAASVEAKHFEVRAQNNTASDSDRYYDELTADQARGRQIELNSYIQELQRQ